MRLLHLGRSSFDSPCKYPRGPDPAVGVEDGSSSSLASARYRCLRQADESAMFCLCTTTVQDPLVTHLGLQRIVPIDLGFKVPDLCCRSSEFRVLL